MSILWLEARPRVREELRTSKSEKALLIVVVVVVVLTVVVVVILVGACCCTGVLKFCLELDCLLVLGC